MTHEIFSAPLETLRKKWSEIPAGNLERMTTSDMLNLSDAQLHQLWKEKYDESTGDDQFSVRGWYHTLYREFLSSRKIMDVGSGFGIDGISFAKSGAQVTFVDIVESNLEILQRICHHLNLSNVHFNYISDFSDFDQLPLDFEVIWAQGSMINAPFEVMQQEVAKILEHLPPGGRWIELAYPRERWLREGSLPFNEWGKKTDGETTPWMEYYDLERLLKRLSPARFNPILNLNFHNDDFNWFDLLRVS